MEKKLTAIITALMMVVSILAFPTVSVANEVEADEIAVTEPVAVTDEQNVAEDEIGNDEILPETESKENMTNMTVESENIETVNEDAAQGDLSAAVITMAGTNYAYDNGNAVCPAFKVTIDGVELVAGTDYTVTYSDNVYPGTAKVILTGINNYVGTAEATYEIAKIQKLNVKATGTESITLSWAKQPYVTGYKVYKYNFTSDTWILYKTIRNRGTTECKVTGLGPGYGYRFKVNSYVSVGDDTYISSDGEALNAPTKPRQVIMTGLTDSIKLSLTAKWKKRNGTGYQVRISRKSNFSTYSTYKATSSKTLEKTITGLRDKSKYYVKVRAYKTYGGKTSYGLWSKVKTVKTDGTGWAKFSGKKYYYRAGKPLKGKHEIGNNSYFFNRSTGVLQGASSTMWDKVRYTSSETKWLVAVSRDMNRVCVYKGKKGNWVVQKYFLCTTGKSSTPTPRGYFTMPTERSRKPSFGDGYTCWYATRIVGNVYFHSVLYNPMSKSSLQDGRLGRNLSHGCIRMALNDAKWIYNNIPAESKVIIY